jgi:VIT1/CCC1 family predicted Fe2+/Mn2+ transporter
MADPDAVHLNGDQMARIHSEWHRSQHIGWLRASVLGANDGAISTASLVVGVAAAQATQQAILIAGFAGLAAGAMSMAAGEYVSVSSQADTEKADLARETRELAEDVEGERKELAGLYVARGLTPELAAQVATQLMAHDALGAHAKDELGITERQSARPVQAAAASAVTFVVGAVIPVLLAAIVPRQYTIVAVTVATLCILTILGALAAKIGGARMWVGALRVTFWGALAMGVTASVGALFHIAV